MHLPKTIIEIRSLARARTRAARIRRQRDPRSRLGQGHPTAAERKGALELIHRIELRADLQHLWRWRKSVEQAQSYTFKAAITIIVTGFVGAVWLGLKVLLGK
jgi:hypothetical protein